MESGSCWVSMEAYWQDKVAHEKISSIGALAKKLWPKNGQNLRKVKEKILEKS